jgi:hypothetical protein
MDTNSKTMDTDNQPHTVEPPNTNQPELANHSVAQLDPQPPQFQSWNTRMLTMVMEATNGSEYQK